MKRTNIILTLAIIASLLAPSLRAEIKLPQVLSSGMVVQRDAPVELWGKADAGQAICVRIANAKGKAVGDKVGYYTVANEQGDWQISLPKLRAGGPYTIKINDISLTDVLSGDVFFCSGQSNMELPVSRVTDMFADEVAQYSNPNVRHFNVPNKFEFNTPMTDVKATAWKPTTPQTAMNFSALGYFFGNDLNARTGVPVGIIRSCWGGTPVEAWISDEAIQPFPLAVNEKKVYNDAEYRDAIKRLEGQNYAHWNAALYAGDPGVSGNLKWYAADFDDSAWQPVDIFTGTLADGSKMGNDGMNAIPGSHWFRKDFELSPEQAANDAILRMGCIIDADSVYVNGTFVGSTGYQYPPRIYKVPAKVLKEGKNNVTVRVITSGGAPKFVAEKPYELRTPAGTVELKEGWRYRLGTPMPNGPGMQFWCYKPTVLYNAMVNPFIKLPVAGTVWYQGESNVTRRNEYGPLLTAMIKDWRAKFGQPEMPFYIVELAEYLHPSNQQGRKAWAEMRQIQAHVADVTPNAYLIKNEDLGEWNDIHPLNKKTLGQRVADAVIGHDMMKKNK